MREKDAIWALLGVLAGLLLKAGDGLTAAWPWALAGALAGLIVSLAMRKLSR